MCTYTHSIQTSASRIGVTYGPGQEQVKCLSSRGKQDRWHLEETHSTQLRMGKEQWKKTGIKEEMKKTRWQHWLLRTQTGRLKVPKCIYMSEHREICHLGRKVWSRTELKTTARDNKTEGVKLRIQETRLQPQGDPVGRKHYKAIWYFL